MTGFIVFSLPRSRSAWLSVFLSSPGELVGHDIGVECASVADFLGRFLGLAGTCETGAAFAWPLIKDLLPRARVAVISRPVDEVVGSLERFGFANIRPEIERRAADLAVISASPHVLTVPYADLANAQTVGALHRHCLKRRMDRDWWRAMDPINVQVDMRRQMERVAGNQTSIASLKAEVARQIAPKGLSITIEPWSDAFWNDAERLAIDHFGEVDGGIEPNRPFKLDKNLMSLLDQAGSMKIITARKDGELVGYYTWNVLLDVESEGLLIAQQGAWYVASGNPKAAALMFVHAKEQLKALGVQCIYPHHRTQGRGANIGRFFRRQGAKEIQHTYSLWIGD